MPENAGLSTGTLLQGFWINYQRACPCWTDLIPRFVATAKAIVQDIIIKLRGHFGHAIFINAVVAGDFQIFPARLEKTITRDHPSFAFIPASIHDAAAARKRELLTRGFATVKERHQR